MHTHLPRLLPKQVRDEAARANKAKESELAGGNPLMHIAGAGDVTFAVKRRWAGLGICWVGREGRDAGHKHRRDLAWARM